MDLNSFLTKPLFVFLIFLFIFSIVIYNVKQDPLAAYYYSILYIFLFLGLSATGLYVSTQYSTQTKDFNWIFPFFLFLFVLGFTLFCLHFDYFYNIIAKSFMVYLLIFFIFITGFTIFYNVLKNLSVSTDSNYLLQIVFFIPCMITDFIQYVGEEYKTTPNVVFVLFVLEIILVLLYFYLPVLLTAMSKQNRIGILDNSAFLDKQVILRNSESFLIQPPPSSTFYFNNSLPSVINRNYSIAMWVYISSPEKREETEIFNYANHPRLTYLNNTDNTKFEQNKYIMYFSDKVSYSFTASQQKWNFIVANYKDSGICDLFLNGDLIKSADIGDSMPVYHLTDTISIGQEHGVYGSISNISYYKEPLTLSKIATIYNLLMFRNPPIFLTTTPMV